MRQITGRLKPRGITRMGCDLPRQSEMPCASVANNITVPQLDTVSFFLFVWRCFFLVQIKQLVHILRPKLTLLRT